MQNSRFLEFPPTRLKELLSQSQLSIADFAKLMGVSATQARQWVQEKSKPYRKKLPDFLRVFGLDSEFQLFNKELAKKFSGAGLEAIGAGSEDLGSLLVRNDGLAKSRMVFWDTLRTAYTKYSHANGEKRWLSLQELVEQAPPPPGLPLPPDEHLVDYPTQYGRTLKGTCAILYQFCNAVYPAFQAGSSLSDFSIVPNTEKKKQFDEFHLARMDLSKLWNRIGKLVFENIINFQQILRTVPTASPLINLTSYLEISLAQWCRNRGPGKEYLFRLNIYWKEYSSSD